MILDIVIALLVGGLIGLVTNGIAIKMLFRPLRPIYIGKFRLPFTPGLIPKERSRIASAIGEIVSNDLLGVDTLKDTLLSDSMKGHFNTKIDQAISRYAQSGDTVSSLVERFVSGDTVRQKLKEGEEALALIITKKAIEQNVGKTIVDYAYEEIISKTKPILKGLTSSALNSVKQPFEKKIGEMIEEKSGPLVEKFITDQANEIWRMPLNVIIERYQDKIPQMKHYIWNVYEDIVRNRIEEVMKTLDISEVINKKINNLDLLELEKIINTLVKKELNALIWLGGLLGMVMGLFNVIFDLIS